MIGELRTIKNRCNTSMGSQQKEYRNGNYVQRPFSNVVGPQQVSFRNTWTGQSYSPYKNNGYQNFETMNQRSQSPYNPNVRFQSPSNIKQNMPMNGVLSNRNNISNISYDNVNIQRKSGNSPMKMVFQQNQEGMMRKIKVLESRVQELHNQKQVMAARFFAEKQALVNQKQEMRQLLQNQRQQNTDNITRLIQCFQDWKVFQDEEGYEYNNECQDGQMMSENRSCYKDQHQRSDYNNNGQYRRHSRQSPMDILYKNRQKLFGQAMLTNCSPLKRFIEKQNWMSNKMNRKMSPGRRQRMSPSKMMQNQDWNNYNADMMNKMMRSTN